MGSCCASERRNSAAVTDRPKAIKTGPAKANNDSHNAGIIGPRNRPPAAAGCEPIRIITPEEWIQGHRDRVVCAAFASARSPHVSRHRSSTDNSRSANGETPVRVGSSEFNGPEFALESILPPTVERPPEVPAGGAANVDQQEAFNPLALSDKMNDKDELEELDELAHVAI